MSQIGSLFFYSTDEPNDPLNVLERLLLWSGAEKANIVTRTYEQEQSWNDFLERMNTALPIVHVVEDDTEELLGYGVSVQDIPAMYIPSRHLRLDLGESPQGARVDSAVLAGITPDVRGGYRPTELFLGLGGHDLFENARNHHGLFIDRAFASVSFFGYGTPHDWDLFERLVWELPGLKAIEGELQEILGPLKKCIIWSI